VGLVITRGIDMNYNVLLLVCPCMYNGLFKGTGCLA
jgi:hypothetical protein